MKRGVYFLLGFLLQIILSIGAYGENIPKREFRAVWIATVDNINWPSKKGLPIEIQKKEYIKLLDEAKKMKMNAVIVQVRPSADRFYKYPNEEPWSKYLTGVEGKDPGYDPMKFMIEEAHKRNLEFHAWFNPYRVTFSNKDKLPDNHPAKKHKNWIIEYGGKLYYDPGNPQARQFTENIIVDVVKNYDIDAVHMDDYFYPYKVKGANGKLLEFPDYSSYKKYGKEQGLDNWRRENVDIFIRDLSKKIKKEKPYVRFGISPFGVWRNISDDPTGSNTKAGVTNYDTLYADTRLWIKNGWIDYILPQLYWDFNFKPASYGTLVDWWSNEVKGSNTNLYIGHGAYRIGSTKTWKNKYELPNQIEYNRRNKYVQGSAYFGFASLIDNSYDVKETIVKGPYKYEALLPRSPWIDQNAPKKIDNFKGINRENGIHLIWENNRRDYVTYYVIYRSTTPHIDINDSKNIVGTLRTKKGQRNIFVDRNVQRGKVYYYTITAVDRVHNESHKGIIKKIKR
ncbi:glycoside hydrolase family 10 protein [Cetobacterium sp. SF1]|uniref:glycoside hydrolase family 10 protein n=1 Tax=unclassified Cetobacterium TaxID=2630983 RepID=UPI003CEF5B34